MKDSTVFIPLRFTISYEQGSLPQRVALQSQEISPSGFGAIDASQGWSCSDSWSHTLAPGTSVTRSAVLMAQILSNDEPTLTEDLKQRLTFYGQNLAIGFGPTVHESNSGPGAVCSPDHRLFLYRTSFDAAVCDD